MGPMLILFLLFSTYNLTSAIDPCPYNVTECSCQGSILICTGLNTLPPLVSDNLNGSIKILFLLNNHITRVPENSLPPNLSSIAFMNAPITYISPDAFNASTDSLRVLTMSNVNYGQIPEALLNVNNLTTLTFSLTPIVIWNTTVMKHLAKSLSSLSFRYASIYDWPDVFEYFYYVKNINLSNNKISSIPSDAFANKSRLAIITLRGNQLSNVTNLNDALRPVASTLIYLDIGTNKLSSIPPGVARMSRLIRLDISFNLIEDIANALSPQIKDLVLSHNNIKKLTDTTFLNLTLLEVLDLGGNPVSEISNLAFLPMQNLRRLNLESISLSIIPEALTSLKNLQTLSLGYDFSCTCPRKLQIVNWYYSLKNVTISGYCSGKSIIIDKYFQNVTYKQICSGNTLTYNQYMYLAVVVLVRFGVL